MTTSTSEHRPSAPEREAIREELERTRDAYLELIASIPEAQWNRRGGNGGWTRRELAYHTAWSTGRIPGQIEQLRKGKGENPPRFILDPLNLLIGKIIARGATPDSARERFESAIAAIIEKLDQVEDDDWQRGATMFGEPATVESWFHRPAVHFAEHEPDLQPA